MHNRHMAARFEALLQSTIDQATAVLSLMARSVGGGAVTALSIFFTENPLLTAVPREIASILTKDRLTEIGLNMLNNRAATPTEEIRKAALPLGMSRMSVTLAGGVHKVKDLPSKEEIEALALEVRWRCYCQGYSPDKGHSPDKGRAHAR